MNTYLPVTSLQKSPVKTSGVCTIKFCKWEDVASWPPIDPLTGIISASLTLKEGAVLYLADLVDQTRAFEEKQRSGSAGKFFEITCGGKLRGTNGATILSINTMTQHQWVVIVEDRNGYTRLIGNKDSGAEIEYEYTSGTISSSRKGEINFKWEHPLIAPVYAGEAFEIVIGGLTITASCITFIKRFRVGDPGAPMNDGDTVYINDLLVNKKAMVFADGMYLPVDDFSGDIDWTGSIERHIQKALASNTITFVGAVANQELIEVYGYT